MQIFCEHPALCGPQGIFAHYSSAAHTHCCRSNRHKDVCVFPSTELAIFDIWTLVDIWSRVDKDALTRAVTDYVIRTLTVEPTEFSLQRLISPLFNHFSPFSPFSFSRPLQLFSLNCPNLRRACANNTFSN